jgi:hypothetical protein
MNIKTSKHTITAPRIATNDGISAENEYVFGQHARPDPGLKHQLVAFLVRGDEI